MKNLKTMTFVDGEFSMDINISVEEKTVWMTANDMAVMFKRDRTAICRQIQNIRKNNALFVEHSCAKFALEGVNKLGIHSRPAMFYNLEIILLVAAKMNSNRGIKLKEFLNDYLSKADSVFEPLDGDNDNPIIIYDNGNIKLAVNVSPKEDTVYLTKDQLAELFSTTRQNIEYHINIIYETKELEEWATCKEFLQVDNLLCATLYKFFRKKSHLAPY